MTNCKICSNPFKDSPDDVVLCDFKEGPVHYGCCVALCSQQGAPCVHAQGVYGKKVN